MLDGSIRRLKIFAGQRCDSGVSIDCVCLGCSVLACAQPSEELASEASSGQHDCDGDGAAVHGSSIVEPGDVSALLMP